MADHSKGDLYERGGVWDKPLTLGQSRMLSALIDFWPSNIHSVLDVGSGDGKVAAKLAAAVRAHFRALDGSAEALRLNPLPSILADATDLSAYDGDYDLVMATDILEHLDGEVEAKTLRNIFATARDCVALAVPFREFRPEATAKCASCSQLYHVNWHQRSYTALELIGRVPDGWVVGGIVLTGEHWTTVPPPVTLWKRASGRAFSQWAEAMCPHCGSGEQCESDADEQLLPSALAEAFYAGFRSNPAAYQLSRSHSEILLFAFRSENAAEAWRRHVGRKLIQRRAKVDFRNWNAAALPLTRDGMSNAAIWLPVFPNVYAGTDGSFNVQFPHPGNAKPLRIRIESPYAVMSSAKIVVRDASRGLAELELPAGTRNIEAEFDADSDNLTYGLIVSFDRFLAGVEISLEGLGDPPLLCLLGSEDSPSYHRIAFQGLEWWVQVPQEQWVGRDLIHPYLEHKDINPKEIERLARSDSKILIDEIYDFLG
jgi:SAM-dependent methyltransferase